MIDEKFSLFEQSLKVYAHKYVCPYCHCCRCIYQHNDDEHICDKVLVGAIIVLDNQRIK